jgi:hypothetical protein
MPRRHSAPDPAAAAILRATMEQKKATLDAMKVAYFHSAPFGGLYPTNKL